MRQTTLAPIAAAPATPPRRALFAALFMISLKVGGVSSPLVVVVVVVLVDMMEGKDNF